jgi:hypothetical protein
MAAARFQIITVLVDASESTRFSWRFLSANNRRLGQSAGMFGDLESCWAAVRQLREHLDVLSLITLRDGLRQWVWRVRLAEADLAVSSRGFAMPGGSRSTAVTSRGAVSSWSRHRSRRRTVRPSGGPDRVFRLGLLGSGLVVLTIMATIGLFAVPARPAGVAGGHSTVDYVHGRFG